jgi:UDP-glucose 4-epimerase
MEKARPDAVMHFAASALVGESMQNPSKYFRNNVLAGTNLLDAMVAVGCRKFVFSSTCATFGIPDRVPIDESVEQRPINPYGESKLMFEKVLRWYDEIHGVKHVALRLLQRCRSERALRRRSPHRNASHPQRTQRSRSDRSRTSTSTGRTTRRQDGTCIRDYITSLTCRRPTCSP